MQILEKTKDEIVIKSEKMSDFLKMEYLENCAKKFTDKEILRYCFKKLSELYEDRIMYSDALKYLSKYEEMCLTNKEKMQAYIKEIEILIKAGTYDKLEFSLKKIKEIASKKEIKEIEEKMIHLLKEEASKYDRLNKYSSALKAYEKLLYLVNPEEKTEIKRKLAYLYNKLGRIRESIEIEKELQR